jgi:hypothetical protein
MGRYPGRGRAGRRHHPGAVARCPARS